MTMNAVYTKARAARHQRGVALVVSLMLLIVVALVGLAAVRSTIMQQKIASNLYDREQAFQAAEAGMRVATALLPSSPALVARNCQASGVTCQGNPFSDPSFPANMIQTVGTGGVAVGSSSSTTFTASAVAAAQPQFTIEFMGTYTDPNSSGGGDSANCNNYGAPCPNSTVIYYRVTSRSGDPAQVGDRAVVTLQATIKQG
jgi:type IV pilus assembly protein PilX